METAFNVVSVFWFGRRPCAARVGGPAARARGFRPCGRSRSRARFRRPAVPALGSSRSATLTDAPVRLPEVRAVTNRLPHALRSDAADNRARILDAARALFSARGLGVPMREIARRAGVGPATLYRRFPTKQALVTEAFADQMRACRAIVDQGSADPDPWHGLCLVIEGICELHARDRGFTEAFMSTFPKATEVTAGRAYTVKAVTELAHRAKEAGHLRPDFLVPDDLILMLMANQGIRAATAAGRAAASRRFAGFVIQMIQASAQHPPLPPAVWPASDTAAPWRHGR